IYSSNNVIVRLSQRKTEVKLTCEKKKQSNIIFKGKKYSNKTRPETNNTSRGSINKGSENEMPVDLVPSPSLEQLGIHPRMQPKAEVQLRMKQWLGVSSSKVSGWIKWLVDILGKALWWQAAIQKSLDVIMAIVEAIQFFTRRTKLEEAFDHGNKYFLQLLKAHDREDRTPINH
ncbi:GSCOCG00010375001-RA-CDS, partial [Cotesia congregata]